MIINQTFHSSVALKKTQTPTNLIWTKVNLIVSSSSAMQQSALRPDHKTQYQLTLIQLLTKSQLESTDTILCDRIFIIRGCKNESQTVFFSPVSWGSLPVSDVSPIQMISSFSDNKSFI